ncbi:hypothetical protein AMECASPLE_028404 [Ameca splendens]|uniref:Uncharacterized protein n=1 Tax=Ameca splendens TaxID=208324 RepID=A0ABV0ZSA7_9TELE
MNVNNYNGAEEETDHFLSFGKPLSTSDVEVKVFGQQNLEVEEAEEFLLMELFMVKKVQKKMRNISLLPISWYCLQAFETQGTFCPITKVQLIQANKERKAMLEAGKPSTW